MPDVLALFHASKVGKTLDVMGECFRHAHGKRRDDGEFFGHGLGIEKPASTGLTGKGRAGGTRQGDSDGGHGLGGWLLAQDRPIHLGVQYLARDAGDGFNVWAVFSRDAVALFPVGQRLLSDAELRAYLSPEFGVVENVLGFHATILHLMCKPVHFLFSPSRKIFV
jgi:hypothetical protein